jgi:uncharacterized membrane protein
MLLEWVQIGKDFIQANGAIVISVIGFTEIIKIWLKNIPNIKSWVFTAVAFAIAFLCLAPSGVELVKYFNLPFLVKWIAVGGVSVGWFKVGVELSERRAKV